MAEKLEFNCTQDDLQNLIKGNTLIADFLNDLFTEPAKYAQMCTALQSYHRNDGGSPEVHSFTIENTAFDANAMLGRFRCRFKVMYHYTCSDVHNTAGDTIDWTFKITHQTLQLTGEEVLERDGDEF
ncbi:hypothetical protein [Mucilaginibacter aquatilis]|uniref:Nuclear transport factor 2 family protein n=1 Tax=Mucilaginibacter aquatilis TaxID=1517760 RepID=A0A6I4IPK4_9SPHI|nr:hypothetical protein [Mucilaginibacter aquatilis]MVN90163.1 hypothetical protein [Mucilaginibacter aquatilis]